MKNAGLPFRLQVMLFPVTDARMGQKSYQLFGEGHLLTSASMQWFNNNYSGVDTSNWLASPLLAEHNTFEGLPPALVVTASHDILRDEGAEYAEKLRAAGCVVKYKCYSGQIHIFLHLPKVIDGATSALTEV